MGSLAVAFAPRGRGPRGTLVSCPGTDGSESSPLRSRLVEAALFQILNQRHVYELCHVGPAKLRPAINPISPFRMALDRQPSGPRILPGHFGLGLCHRPISASSLLNPVSYLSSHACVKNRDLGKTVQVRKTC